MPAAHTCSVSAINCSVKIRAASSSLFLRRLQISRVRRLVKILCSLAAMFSNSRLMPALADAPASLIAAPIVSRNSAGIYAKSSGYMLIMTASKAPLFFSTSLSASLRHIILSSEKSLPSSPGRITKGSPVLSSKITFPSSSRSHVYFF